MSEPKDMTYFMCKYLGEGIKSTLSLYFNSLNSLEPKPKYSLTVAVKQKV